MKNADFEKLLDERLGKIRAILGNKAKEYALGQDRLHNFKIAASISGSSKAKALWGIALKHLVSVIDLVEGRLEPSVPMVDEKVGDLINYLILLEAVLKEPLICPSDEKRIEEALEL